MGLLELGRSVKGAKGSVLGHTEEGIVREVYFRLFESVSFANAVL